MVASPLTCSPTQLTPTGTLGLLRGSPELAHRRAWRLDGGRGDDGGAMSKMDWIVVWWWLRASLAEVWRRRCGPRLALAGEGEAERGRESESE